jgi:hypothetical protein
MNLKNNFFFIIIVIFVSYETAEDFLKKILVRDFAKRLAFFHNNNNNNLIFNKYVF